MVLTPENKLEIIPKTTPDGLRYTLEYQAYMLLKEHAANNRKRLKPVSEHGIERAITILTGLVGREIEGAGVITKDGCDELVGKVREKLEAYRGASY